MSNAVELYNRSMELLGYWGEPREEAEAFKLNREAAQLGHNDAILAMGYFYLNGQGVEKDIELAEYWYKKAARCGNPRAMFSLGWMAYDALAYSQAYLWFRRASHKGHIRSIYWLGKLAWRGHGVAECRSEAFALFQSAARRNDPEAIRVLRFLSRREEKKTNSSSHSNCPQP